MITNLLKHFCSVGMGSIQILDGNGLWNGEWSITVRLLKDSTNEDGVQHLLQTFSLDLYLPGHAADLPEMQ